MKKRIIPIVVVVVVLGVAWLLWTRRDRGQSGPIVVSGNIELTEVDIAFKLPGKLVERAVTEGDRVQKGMLVARLDQEQLLRQRDRAEAATASSESRLTQLHTSIAYQTENLAAQTEQRKAELRQVEAFLAALLAGSRTQEVEQSKAQVVAAQTAFDKAKKDWERAQVLAKTEDISASDVDRYRSAFEGADATLKQAREKLALVVEGPRKEDIDGARAQVERARAALKTVEAARLDLERMRQEQATRKAEIAQTQADRGVVSSQLSDTVAISPVDGVVLSKAAEPGEVLAAGTTVLTVGDIDHPWVRAYINERDLGRVKLGMKAKVTTDSFPGKTYSGRVSFISPEAEFTPKQIQTKEERVKLVYRIKIEVENPRHELKSNMPADAELEAE